MPKVRCENCEAVLNCEDRKLGQTLNCPKCGQPTKLELQNKPDTWNGLIRDEPVKSRAVDRQIQRLKKKVRNRTVAMIAILVLFAAVGFVLAFRMSGEPDSKKKLTDKIAKLEAEKVEWLTTQNEVKKMLVAEKLRNEKMVKAEKEHLADINKISAGTKRLIALNAELEKKAIAWDALVAAKASQDAVRTSALEEKWSLFSQEEKDRVVRIRKVLKSGERPKEDEDYRFLKQEGWDFLKYEYAAMLEKEWNCKSLFDWLGLKGEVRISFFKLGIEEQQYYIQEAQKLKKNSWERMSRNEWMKRFRNNPFFHAKLLELQRKK